MAAKKKKRAKRKTAKRRKKRNPYASRRPGFKRAKGRSRKPKGFAAGSRGLKKTRKKRKAKGQIPSKILVKRYVKLGNLLKRRKLI